MGTAHNEGVDGGLEPAPDGPAVRRAWDPPTFSFVVLGDTQYPTHSCRGTVPERTAIPLLITRLAPDFVLHVGDLVDRGGEDGAFDTFVACSADYLVVAPLFPTLGNHDEDYGLGITTYRSFLREQLLVRNLWVAGAFYRRAFRLHYHDDPNLYSTSFATSTQKDNVPSGVSYKTYYAFRHRNAYFLSFEQGVPLWSNTPYAWVEKHLRVARDDPTIQHRFVFMHHPLYISTSPESDLLAIRRHYEPLFRRYNVTMVLSGHAHLYYHSVVPDSGAATRTESPPSWYPHDGAAVHYLVTGGGSWAQCDPMPAERPEPSHAYLQRRACGNHVTRVTVTGDRLAVEALRVRGDEGGYSVHLMDRFTLR